MICASCGTDNRSTARFCRVCGGGLTPAESSPNGHRVLPVIACETSEGRVRELDEDSLLILNFTAICEGKGRPDYQFLAVADGIGGHAAGEVASRLALHQLAASIFDLVFTPLAHGTNFSRDQLTALLTQSVLAANNAVFAEKQRSGQGCGCTLTCALIHRPQVIVANVGDSRTYHLNNGQLEQVSRDHSVLFELIASGAITPEEAKFHPQRHVINRSLGDSAAINVDTFDFVLQPGNKIMLCCDGLWEKVDHAALEKNLLTETPDFACQKLVDLANKNGGEDNISIIVAAY